MASYEQTILASAEDIADFRKNFDTNIPEDTQYILVHWQNLNVAFAECWNSSTPSYLDTPSYTYYPFMSFCQAQSVA